MNGCSAVQDRFNEYLDGRLSGREMQRIAAHLERCRVCTHEWALLRQTQESLAELGPVPEPEDLPCVESRLEKHGRPIPAAGRSRFCQRGAAHGNGDCARDHVCPA